MKLKKNFLVWIIFGIIIIIGFFILNNQLKIQPETEFKESKIDFEKIELKDVKTSQKFIISEFNKPVLLESFAVWCPVCTKQQEEIKKLHDDEEFKDKFISISLDTDPNENEQKVLEYIKKNNFNWIFAISPPEITKSLIDEFGNNFVNAPQAPVVLICNNKVKQLKSGIKSVAELKEEINNCFEDQKINE